MGGEDLTKSFDLKQIITTMNVLSHIFIQIVLHVVQEGIKAHKVLYFTTLISSLVCFFLCVCVHV